MKINQKRNLFVFVTLLISLIWFLYYNIGMLSNAFSNPEYMDTYIYFLPQNILVGVGVVLCFLAYRKYTPKKMLLTLVFFSLSAIIGFLREGEFIGFMILPAIVTSILALFLKINQDSTKFVGK